MSETDRTMPGAAPSVYPVVRLIASVMLVTMGGAAMYAVIVALKPASFDFNVSRGLASVPYMLFMLTGGIGGVFMGRLADRFGVLVPVLIGCVGLPAGMAGAAYAEEFWQFCAALGVLSGLFGTSALFAPVAADISHWFTRRRGLAVAVVITGTYFAGALWPPIVQASLDARGWRETFLIIAIVMACVMLPLTAALYRKPVVLSAAQAARTATGVGRPLGFAPGHASKPDLRGRARLLRGDGDAPGAHRRSHLGSGLRRPARRRDAVVDARHRHREPHRLRLHLGPDRRSAHAAARLCPAGAGARRISRRRHAHPALRGLGDLRPLPGRDRAVPIRSSSGRSFPRTKQAGRVGWAMLFTFAGMALGGWMAGALYDLTGSYTASFINAIAFNVLNAAIVLYLTRRRQALAA